MNKLLVCDNESLFALEKYKDYKKILFKSHNENPKKNLLSIYNLIDKNPYYFRKKLLENLHSISNLGNYNKKIKNLFLIDGFNFWECSVFREKVTYGSDNPFLHLLKFIVLKNYIKIKKIKQIQVISQDKLIINILSQFSKTKKIHFSCKFVTKYNIFNITKLKEFTPPLIKAIFYLIIIAFRNLSFKSNFEIIKKNSICFFDIFTHLSESKLKKGEFFSNYWTDLIGIVKKKNYQTNWFHLFYPQKITPNENEANLYIKKINSLSKKNIHYLIDRFSLLNLLIVLKIYFTIFFKAIFVKYLLKKKFTKEELNIFKIFSYQFSNSLYGSRAIINILYYVYFRSLFKSMPYQVAGFYIFENQNWEKFLVHFWKKNNNGSIYAVPHANISFWDLRFFEHEQSNFTKGLYAPNFWVVNSENSDKWKNILVKNGLNKKNFLNLEPLRYLNLQSVKYKKKDNKKFLNKINILIVMDLFPTTGLKLISIIENTIDKLKNVNKVYVKFHPASGLTDFKFKSNKILNYNKDIIKIISKIDLFISSNTTSAVYYAKVNNIPFLTYLDNSEFNFSPFYPQKNNQYFFDERSLLFKISNKKFTKPGLVSYKYCRKKNISQWNRLLSKKTGVAVS
jgi:surface carbohydrate biosynthesis protein (TIGR04326 family)